jgi:predicted metalloprotease with PDZ domain
MRASLIVVFAATVFSMASPVWADDAPKGPYSYDLSPVMDAKGLKNLIVTLSFRADQTGPITLDLPDTWGGGDHLYEHLKDVTVTGAQSVTTPDAHTRVIQARAGNAITLRYRIDANLAAGQYPTEDNKVAPAVSPDYFHLSGQAVFASVRDSYDAPARFHWTGAKGWTFVSPLEASDLTVMDVIRSISLGGTQVKVAKVQTPQTNLRVASVGAFDFDLDDFNASVAKIMVTEQAFWGDGQKAFVVALSPITVTNGQYMRGTGASNAFDMMSSSNVPEDMLKITLAHEYFHSWNPMALGGPEAGKMSGYWFSEGLTDYYGRKMALRAGMIDLKAYVRAWNVVLDSNAASPLRAAPNTVIAEQFWKNGDADQLAYDRGGILAAYWNHKWRDQGVTLDRFMLALRDAVKANPKLADMTFPARLQIVADTLGISISDDLDQHVVQGVPVTLAADTFGGCLRVSDIDTQVMDKGYDADKTGNTGVFAGVEPGSAAYEAGLRNGMVRLARLGGVPGDMTVPFSFRVRDTDGQERVITYLPVSRKSYRLRRIVIPDGLSAAQLKDCTAQVAAY